MRRLEHLERELLRSQDKTELEDILLLESPVHQGAPFEGKRVRDLDLPRGCLIITPRRGVREDIPTGDTRLQAEDYLTAAVAPEATEAALQLRDALRRSGGESAPGPIYPATWHLPKRSPLTP